MPNPTDGITKAIDVILKANFIPAADVACATVPERFHLADS